MSKGSDYILKTIKKTQKMLRHCTKETGRSIEIFFLKTKDSNKCR